MSELRKDPIVDRWVIITAKMGRRPTDFAVEDEPQKRVFCPFCPGNESKTPPETEQWGRPEGAPPNTKGWGVRVVANKYPALSPDAELDRKGLGMYDQMNGAGIHEVIIESPRHDFDIAGASPAEMQLLFSAYTARLQALSKAPRFLYTIVFRNQGGDAGASLAHPHSQIISLPIIPAEVKERLDAARSYYGNKRRCVFCDVIRQERTMKDRVVEENEHFVVLSPFAARFPFELQIYPLRHCHDFTLMTPAESQALGETLTRALRGIKCALNNPSHNVILQTAPHLHPRPGRPGYWGTLPHDYHWHINVFPRLTQTVGFEWGTGFYINPVSPESATSYLRDAMA